MILGVGATVFALSYLSRPFYAAEVKLVYVEETGMGVTQLMTGGSASTALRSLGIGGGGDAVMLPEILRSTAMLTQVLSDSVTYSGRSMPLSEVYLLDKLNEPHAFDKLLDKFRKVYLQAVYDSRTDVVRLQVLAPDQVIASRLANRMAELLNDRLVRNSTERARRQKSFIEDRLGQVQEELRLAENSLRDFRLENRSVQDSPSLRMIEAQFAREVALSEQLYTTLAAQYELARIEEVKNLPVIDVIDPARVPYQKAKPRRAFRMIAGLLAAGVALLGWDALRYLLIAELEAA